MLFDNEPLDNLRRHHLIQGANIGLKEGIETATEHMARSSDRSWACQALNRLVSEELGNMCRVPLRKRPFTIMATKATPRP